MKDRLQTKRWCGYKWRWTRMLKALERAVWRDKQRAGGGVHWRCNLMRASTVYEVKARRW